VVGISFLFFNIYVFLAFLIMPKLADSKSDFDLDSSGTDFALLIVVVFSLVSTVASYLVEVARKFEKKVDSQSTSALVADTFSAFGKAVIPRDGDSMLRALLNLPPALYLAILGNKAVFYFFNTFSLFSASVYNEKFGLSGSQASLATGLTPLLAGILAPFMGRAMDKFGHRSKFFLVGTGLASIGYLLLGISESSAAVWIGSVLFAINNSFGAHVIIMLPMIVGSSRAGLAYGLYGILGNIFDASTSFLSGVILDSGDNGEEMYIWFTFAMTFMGVLAWIGVYVLESRISFIETPLDQIIETRIEYFHFATLCGVDMENDAESTELEELEELQLEEDQFYSHLNSSGSVLLH
jgi:hypothetical protein